MRRKGLGRRGQNTVEYMMMLSVVVGVVLIGGAALKQFMPTLFGNIEQMITGAATSSDDGGSGGGLLGGGIGVAGANGSASGGGVNKTLSGSSSGGGLIASADTASQSVSSVADGGTSAHNDGHPNTKGVAPPHHP
jgi:hypothetical protein